MSIIDDINGFVSRAVTAVTGLAEKDLPVPLGTVVGLLVQLPTVQKWIVELETAVGNEAVSAWEGIKAEALKLIKTHPDLQAIWDAIKPPEPLEFDCEDDLEQAFIAALKDAAAHAKVRADLGLKPLEATP